MKEHVVEFLELGGEYALAGEEQRVGHFAENESQDEGGRGEERGSVQRGGKNFSELSVRDRLRRDYIDRATDMFVFEREAQDGHGVIEADPAHPLAAGADSSAHAKLKRAHHLR